MAILPRIAVVVFRFAQALLISRAIRFVTHFSAASDGSGAYWLVVEATVVYVGMAVSATRSPVFQESPRLKTYSYRFRPRYTSTASTGLRS